MKLYAGYNSGKRELAMGKVIKGSVFKYRIVMRGGYWVYQKIRAFFVSIYWLPYYLYNKVKYKQQAIFCECFMGYNGYHVKKNNWGDDTNLFFFESIIDKKFIFIPFERTLLKVNRYSLIGSIIGYGNLKNVIICGSGIKNPKIRLIGKPQKVYSVRGPKTREILLANHIDCPPNYGDPALLLPIFYHPSVSKKYRYGFVPNEATNEDDVIMCVKNMGIVEGDYLIIHMVEYHDWTDIVDDILSCDYIVSESLHGLIVAETYKIPSCWVEFTMHAKYWSFKYLDFYESIGKSNYESVKLYQEECKMERDVTRCLLNWRNASIKYQKLLTFIPFELAEKVSCSEVKE